MCVQYEVMTMERQLTWGALSLMPVTATLTVAFPVKFPSSTRNSICLGERWGSGSVEKYLYTN
jgi:hypothetical protein